MTDERRGEIIKVIKAAKETGGSWSFGMVAAERAVIALVADRFTEGTR